LKTTLSRDHEAQPRDKLSDGEVELAKEKVCDLRSMEQNLAVTQEASHLCCVPSNGDALHHVHELVYRPLELVLAPLE
jgi:hypothetical protein